MERLKKTIGIIAAALLTLGIVSGCGKEEKKPATGDGDKKAVIQIGTDAAYAPFEYLDAGKIVGFDADFLDAVMKEAGLEYELKHTGWDPIFAGIGSKQLEMGISSITIDEDRQKTYDFSNAYYESRNMIMVKEGSTVKTAADLKGVKKIAVQSGTTADMIMTDTFGKDSKKVAKFESNVLAIMALKNGEVDAVVCDNGVAQYYVKMNPNDKMVAIDDAASFPAEYYGILMVKGTKYKEQVDKGIKAIVENGKYAEIYKKWFEKEPNIENLKEEW
ncbi:MAG: basic amino acid ABC transporter substrate-binding protein [Bacillaceae bacterium]